MIRLNLHACDPRVEWPVVAVDDGDVVVFDDLAALVMGVEEPDVFEVEVFDAAGYRLRLWIQQDAATVMRGEATPEHLRRVLRRFLETTRGQSDPTASLADLIDAAR